MAELGETGDPRALVPGDPAAIVDNVVAVRARGEAMATAADGLHAIDTYAWTGPAADRFREKFSYEPGRWRQAADAFENAAVALDSYADTLRWAQEQATEAIRLWDSGQAKTDQARQQHDTDTRAAEEANQHNSAHGHPPVPMPVFSDPGEGDRQAARELLARARQQLTEVGDRTGATLQQLGDTAPEQSFWGDVGDFFGAVGSGIAEFGKGLWDAGAATVEAVGDLITDPVGTIASSVANLVTNPVDVLKGIVAWDTWSESPGRAIGQITGGLVLGGIGGKLLKGGKDRTPDGDPPGDRPLSPEEKQRRYDELGTDPTGKYRPGEVETARILEEQHGISLDRSPDPKVDWVDKAGKTYDAVGPFDGKHLQYQWNNFTRQIDRHLEKADFVPINVSQFTPEQIARVREYIAPLGARVFIIGE